MQAIEFEATIDSSGDIHVPERYHRLYGRNAQFVVLLPDIPVSDSKTIDPMQDNNRVDWPGWFGLPTAGQGRMEVKAALGINAVIYTTLI